MSEIAHSAGTINFRLETEDPELMVIVRAINVLIETNNQNRLTSGPGYRLRRGPNGTAVPIKPVSSPPATASNPGWPFKVYDASQNGNGVHTAQVRINSGDGFVGMIQGAIGNVNGALITTPPVTNPPTAPPYLAVSPGSGFVYIKVYLKNDGYGNFSIDKSKGGASGVDCLYSSVYPNPDTANPITFLVQVIALCSVNTDSQGNVSVAIDNTAAAPGYSNFYVCNNVGTII